MREEEMWVTEADDGVLMYAFNRYSGPLYASDLITIWQCFNKSYICGISTM